MSTITCLLSQPRCQHRDENGTFSCNRRLQVHLGFIPDEHLIGGYPSGDRPLATTRTTRIPSPCRPCPRTSVMQRQWAPHFTRVILAMIVDPIHPNQTSQLLYPRRPLPWVRSCRVIVRLPRIRVLTFKGVLFLCWPRSAHYRSSGRQAFLNRGHHIPILVWPPILGLWVWLQRGGCLREQCTISGVDPSLDPQPVRVKNTCLPPFISVYSICNPFPSIDFDSRVLRDPLDRAFHATFSIDEKKVQWP